MRKHQNLPFFMKNRPKMAVSWSKIEFFGFRHGVEDPSPRSLRVLDAHKQAVGPHRSQEHNLQHVYAPNFAIFHGKWPFFGQKLSFLPTNKQLKTPPRILSLLDAKKHVVWSQRAPKRNLQHANYLKGCFF